VIQLSGVSKSFDGGKTVAVRDVTLSVAAGEFVVLLGESGCGKTTTLKMINRLIERDSGTIHVHGEDTSRIDPVQLRRRIGYVFQEIGLFPHLTVGENAGAVPKLLGRSQTEIRERTEAVLSMVGLDPAAFRNRRPTELSGGQKQRVGVARALAAKPAIMLMDEPFGALDPITRIDLQNNFKKLQRDLSLTVVMVTHDIYEALLLADRIAIMSRGEIVAQGTPAELMRNPGHPYAEALLSAPRDQVERLARLSQGGDAS
jgi:osmoprotectant transport system ATP-binding protein